MDFKDKLKNCGVVEGDEVLTQSAASTALIESIQGLGAKVIFSDAESSNCEICANYLKEVLQSKHKSSRKMPKVIVPGGITPTRCLTN